MNSVINNTTNYLQAVALTVVYNKMYNTSYKLQMYIL